MRHLVTQTRRSVAVVSSLIALAPLLGCDPPLDATSPEKEAMERACALDVRGTMTLVSVGGPAAGTLTVDGADGVPTAVSITIARDALFAAEAPFLAQVDEADRLAPLAFTSAQNRFIGGGTTGNSHSEVIASFSRAAQPGPGGSSASILTGLRLIFQNGTDEVTGALQLTFKETRPNVVLEGDSEHQEARSFALRARRAEPLNEERTAACQAAIDAYQASQSEEGPL